MLQNMEVLMKMGQYTGITSELAIPADTTNYIPLAKRPPITAQVVIGTPGTIGKWVSAKKLGMSCMKILVFDEADHMLAEVVNSLSALASVPLILPLLLIFIVVHVFFKLFKSLFFLVFVGVKNGFSLWFLRWAVVFEDNALIF